jgi:regulator of protease activity HflC (stomatin/prohibitin superfamily)
MRAILGLGILGSAAICAALWGWSAAGLWVIILLSLATLLALINGLRFLPANQAIAILRRGAYERAEGPGLALALPFIESFGPTLDLWQVQREEFQVTQLLTRDEIYVDVEVSTYFRVDPRIIEDRALASQAFHNSDEQWRKVLGDLVVLALRDVVARLEAKTICDPARLAWLQRETDRRVRNQARTYGIVLEQQRGMLIKAIGMPDSLQEAVVRAQRLDIDAQAIQAFKDAVGPSLLREALALALMEDRSSQGVILPALAVDLTDSDEAEKQAVWWTQEISAKGG